MVSISSHILEVWRFRVRLDPGLSKAWLLSLTQLYLPPCGLYSQASSSQEVPAAPATPLAASSKCLQWKGSTAFPVAPGKSLGRTPTGLTEVTCPTLIPSVRTWGNEMSWWARPGSGAYLWSERGGLYLPVPTGRGKNSSTEENQEVGLEKRGSQSDTPVGERKVLEQTHFTTFWDERAGP